MGSSRLGLDFENPCPAWLHASTHGQAFWVISCQFTCQLYAMEKVPFFKLHGATSATFSSCGSIPTANHSHKTYSQLLFSLALLYKFKILSD